MPSPLTSAAARCCSVNPSPFPVEAFAYETSTSDASFASTLPSPLESPRSLTSGCSGVVVTVVVVPCSPVLVAAVVCEVEPVDVVLLPVAIVVEPVVVVSETVSVVVAFVLVEFVVVVEFIPVVVETS